LLFGEYLVLKGSGCLAIPLNYGQKMQVESSKNDFFEWTSKYNDATLLSCIFSKTLETINTSDLPKAQILIRLMKIIKETNPDLFGNGLNFHTEMNFQPQWGFGSSSTFVSLLAQWSKMDPYLLLKKSFGGSGYDIACATAQTPVIYDVESRQTVPVYLFPKVTSKILFVYSGEKKDSSEAVKQFRAQTVSDDDIEKMKRIIIAAANATQVDVFEEAMEESENLLSHILKLKPVKEIFFADYPYAIKSLGAWGGDFFMASFRKEVEARKYFQERGYSTLFNYNELIKK
ncbi:MAG TPA: GYDIA family GHMP kinase, partial [Hanamia sp.]|nr:GYDIA family GHMP kinase [Hanamia sp.]